MKHSELQPIEMEAIDPRFRPTWGNEFDEAAFVKRYPDLKVRRDNEGNIMFMADVALVRLLHDDPYLLHQPQASAEAETLPAPHSPATLSVAVSAEVVPIELSVERRPVPAVPLSPLAASVAL